MLVPEHNPVRYFPVAQLVLEQVEHAASEVPEQPPLLYLPVPHVAHVLHVPADVEEGPERYFPVEHDVWAEHAVSDMPEQPLLLYWPVPQVAQARHVPGLAPKRYWLSWQTTGGGGVGAGVGAGVVGHFMQ